MADYLLEIGTEEIPAKFIPGALKQMEDMTAKALEEKRISYKIVKALGTPRRLALKIEGLALKGEDVVEEVRGPAKKAAFDAQGQPTKAVLGFARSQGVNLEDLEIKTVNGNEYVFAKKEIAGQSTKDVLPEIMTQMISSLYFPKPMRWGDLDFRFARPIRWLVSLLDDEVIPFTLANVTAGRQSRGHRILGAASFDISSAAVYEDEMEKQYVIVDQDKRKAIAWQQIQNLALEKGVVVEADEELIEEVTYLIEWPTALMGKFDESYLEIPEEVVITPMREHQRYFPVRDKSGKLINHFVTVRNGGDYCLDVVTAGNEKVLAARLADARFFWDEDRKKHLEEWLPRLEKVVFQEKLGTIGDKVRRIEALTLYLAEECNVADKDKAAALRAAHLCKADLVTSMVCEFTELQGIMGRYYALESKEDEAVAQAILEHYQPRFAGDQPAGTVPGALVAIADKIDTIAGIFAIGIEPTGSQDPYALRRACMGICQTVLAQDLKLNIDSLINRALSQYAFVCPEENREKVRQKIKEFFAARLKNILDEQGHRYDVIDAAMAAEWQELQAVTDRAQALSALRDDEDFKKLLAVFTRANNLAKKEESSSINQQYLLESSEKALYQAIKEVEAKLERTKAQEGLKGLIRLLSTLAQPINDFFENVMVMAEDDNIRANRLALLKAIVGMSRQIGDLSKLTE